MRILSIFVALGALALGFSPAIAQEGKPVSKRKTDPNVQGFHIAPHLNNVTKDGVTLIWETRQPEAGTVEYGLDAKYGQQVAGEAGQTIHRVRITGLTAETEYHYRVTSGADVLESTFKTAPASSRPITYIVIGDSRRWGNRWAETNMEAHAAQWDPEFYLTMGDLVPSGHNKEQWPEHFTRFEGIVSKMWMATARGNHEGSMIFDPENDYFGKYHEQPGKGEPFATFQWGNTFFAMISFEQTYNADKFLDEELPRVKQDPSVKYVVLSHHFPVYCSGYAGPEDSRKEMGDGIMSKLAHAIDKHSVTLDLVGHTHIYERLHAIRDRKRNDREGTMYVVNGGDIGGNYPEAFTAVADDKETMDQPTYTVYHMGDDRIWFRTFCWSKVESKIVEIDYHVLWKDESVPKAIFSKLGSAEGEDLLNTVTELGAMVYGPAAKALLPYLDSTDAALKRAAAKALRSIGTATVSADLVKYLNDGDLAVRREIARALEIAMDPAQAPAVLAAAKDAQQDDNTRVSLLGALQFHGPAESIAKEMVELLKQPGVSDKVRERAVYTLSRTAGEDSIPVLFDLFRVEPSTNVTVRLAWALNRLTSDQQSLDGKAPIGQSKPGADREQFIDLWKKKLALKKAA